MDKYYLKVGKSPDLKDKKERFLFRFFEVLPGAVIWLTLIGMILLSWLKPVWAAFFIIAFCLLWLLRAFQMGVYLVLAYKKMKANIKTNWLEKLDSLSLKEYNVSVNAWKDIYHLVILPMYKEDEKIVRETFEKLVESDYDKKKMIVVLAIEERAGNAARKTAEKISNDFGEKFFKFLITVHPDNISGEIAGKGSNENWAGKRAKEELIDALNIPYENVIVSCLDIDTQIYSQYFSCLTYHYLTAKNPVRSSYQPVPLYLNNLWESPFFSRVVSSCNVFWQMMQQQRPEKIVTYSSHSMSFKALVDMDFWQKNLVSEDSAIFWKSFLFYDGDYTVVPLHYPISMDSCAANSFWQTVKNQYKQQRRWAWGAENIPYLLFGCVKNKKIPLGKKISYPFFLIEGFWAWGTNSFLILFLGWLPLFLGGKEFNTTVLAYSLPNITQNLMTISLVGLLVCIIISTLLLTPRPPQYSRWKNFSMIVQWVSAPLTFIIFGAIPAIEAQTRLMFGKYMGFWVTEKARKK